MTNPRLIQALYEFGRKAHRLNEKQLITGRRISSTQVVLRDATTPTGAIWAREFDESRGFMPVYQAGQPATNVAFTAYLDEQENWVFKHPNNIVANLQTQGNAQAVFAAPVVPGISTVSIEGLSFAPLRVNFDPSGGLSVLVSEGWHAGGFFGGDVIDLTANVPSTAGHVRWVVVGVDTAANALTAINGTSFAGDQNDLVVSEIADIPIPVGITPLGAVALENGQTAIVQGTGYIVDVRRFGGNVVALNNFNATTAPTATDDASDGYSVGSIWINVTDDLAFVCLDATVGAAVWQEIGSDTGLLNNLTATVVPTVNDDDTLGYSAGSVWVMPFPNYRYFVCLDAQTGGAAWIELEQLHPLLKSMTQIPVNGLFHRLDGVTADTCVLVGTANRIVITNGDAVAGDPTFDIGSDVVTLAGSQTLTNKTLTLPTIGDYTNATHNHENAAGGGTLNASAIAAGLLAPARRFSEVVVTSTGTINNLAISNATVVLMNNASDATIQGIAGGVAGQRLTIVSIGAGNVFLAHQNTGSSAANRLINMVTSANTPLVAGKGYASYIYDATTSRWRMVDHFQGGVISFDMTWTSSGTAPTLGNGTKTSDYEIQRNMCFIQFTIVMGSTTTYGTGTWLFVMPIDRVGGSTRNLVGQITDASAGLIRQVMNTWNSVVNIALAPDSASNIGPTVPWTWAVSDTIAVSGWYRIA